MEVRGVLGARLRRQRMSQGLTQTELAEQTGIPYQVISRLEHGHQSIYIERLVDLATVLKVSLDYLAGLTDDPMPPKKRQRHRNAAPIG